VKGNLKFIVFILLLIPVMFYFEQSFTKEFSWDASLTKTTNSLLDALFLMMCYLLP